MIKEAIVLCGGQGTRLHPVVPDVPKALAPVCGRPMLEYILMDLYAQGIERVVLATGYGHDQIAAAVDTGRIAGLEITLSREPDPLGTGGAARLALYHTTGKRIFVVNGDSYCNTDLQAMGSDAYFKDTSVIWTVPSADEEETLRVETESPTGTGYAELVARGSTGPVNGGVYLFLREHLEMFVPGLACSLEDDLLPSLAARMKLSAICGRAPLVDIGTPERYAAAQELDHVWAGITKRVDVTNHFQRVQKVLSRMMRGVLAGEIVAAAQAIAHCLQNGGKVLACGNGGSAAEAQHFTAELMGRFKRSNQRAPLAAVALTADTAFLTAQANDSGYETVFSRQVEGLGKPGDVLVAISTSGNSPNVVKAIEVALSIPMLVVALGGMGGFDAPQEMIHFPVNVPSGHTTRIQEMHLVIIHVLCDMVEQLLLESGYLDWKEFYSYPGEGEE